MAHGDMPPGDMGGMFDGAPPPPPPEGDMPPPPPGMEGMDFDGDGQPPPPPPEGDMAPPGMDQAFDHAMSETEHEHHHEALRDRHQMAGRASRWSAPNGSRSRYASSG